MSPTRPRGEIRRGSPVSWQHVVDDAERVHGFRLDAGADWKLAAACGRGPATGLPSTESELELCLIVSDSSATTTLAQRHPRRDRATRARVHERSGGIPTIEPLVDKARAVGISAEELDTHHLRLRYDACDHDHWLAIDDIYDATHDHAMLEGDGTFQSAPRNWMVVHFDFAACGESRSPGVSD